jgi:Fe-Mn family superoxide dismutase
MATRSIEPAAEAGTFRLPPLPYPESALEPVIDAETMALHHGKHHAAYVKKLNEAVAARPGLAELSLEALLKRASTLPGEVRNNAGQHYAHSLFWDTMGPRDARARPSGELAEAIDAEFGSFEAMKALFEERANAQFGTGWGWLVREDSGRLAIGTTPDGDVPLMDDAIVKGRPLLVNDLWEHAWYLKYRNEKAKYLSAWWDVVNWEAVAARFAA